MEFFGSGRQEKSSASIDNSTDGGGVQTNEFTRYEAFVTPLDAEDFAGVGESGPNDGSKTGIQARRVPAAGEDTNSFQWDGQGERNISDGFVPHKTN